MVMQCKQTQVRIQCRAILVQAKSLVRTMRSQGYLAGLQTTEQREEEEEQEEGGGVTCDARAPGKPLPSPHRAGAHREGAGLEEGRC